MVQIANYVDSVSYLAYFQMDANNSFYSIHIYLYLFIYYIENHYLNIIKNKEQ